MDDWEKFNETFLPEKKVFYNHLNTKDTTNACKTGFKYIEQFLKYVLKSMGLIQLISFCTRISMASSLKKDQSKIGNIN